MGEREETESEREERYVCEYSARDLAGMLIELERSRRPRDVKKDRARAYRAESQLAALVEAAQTALDKESLGHDADDCVDALRGPMTNLTAAATERDERLRDEGFNEGIDQAAKRVRSNAGVILGQHEASAVERTIRGLTKERSHG